MRLATYRRPGDPAARVGVVTGGDGATIIDAADLLGDGAWSMQRLIDAGNDTLKPLRRALRSGSGPLGTPADSVPVGDIELLAPLPRPGKIVAVGRNYREHVAEEAASVSTDPILFTKYPSAVVGTHAEIRWSAELSREVDYEAELAVVIGRRARSVPQAAALGHVFGYTCLNDVSARDLQVRDGQWVRGKSLDTFCPMGPWITTADELPEPAGLRIRCDVNGQTRQDASTADMIHDVPALIAFCSRYVTLEPGDVLATGTPGGVGAFRDPPVFLADGDIVAVEIDGIGRLENRCRVESA